MTVGVLGSVFPHSFCLVLILSNEKLEVQKILQELLSIQKLKKIESSDSSILAWVMYGCNAEWTKRLENL